VSDPEHEVTCDTQPMSGREALRLIKQNNLFPYWLIVGEELQIGQAQAMRLAQTNAPRGHRFCAEMSAFLKEYGLEEIDSGLRSRLLEVMKHRVEIEAWHRDLPIKKRVRLNHPQTVLAAWKRETQKTEKAEEPVTPEGDPEFTARWNAGTTANRRAALDAGGWAQLLEDLSPTMRADLKQRQSDPDTEKRLAEKDAAEKKTVGEEKKKIAERCPTKGNVTEYGPPAEKPKAKAPKADRPKPPENIKRWNTAPLPELEEMILAEQQRSYELRDKGGISKADFRRLDKMRKRRDALKRTAAAITQQGSVEIPLAERMKQMESVANAPEAAA
jgi:hypothetical protein